MAAEREDQGKPTTKPGPQEQLASEAQLWARFAERATRRRARSWCAATCRSPGSLALRYRGASESFDDLLQVASLGLVNAVDRFDPEPRHPLHGLRLADHPRRAEAPLPRPRLDRAGAARPARPHGRSRQGDRRADRSSCSARPRSARSPSGSRSSRPTCSRCWRPTTTAARSRSTSPSAATRSTSRPPAEWVGERGRGLRAGRGQGRPRGGPPPPRRARAPRPAAALRRGHDPVADRRADRPLPDARLAHPAPHPGADPRARSTSDDAGATRARRRARRIATTRYSPVVVFLDPQLVGERLERAPDLGQRRGPRGAARRRRRASARSAGRSRRR